MTALRMLLSTPFWLLEGMFDMLAALCWRIATAIDGEDA